VQWYTPVIPAIQEAKVGGTCSEATRKKYKTLPEKQTKKKQKNLGA
jgi:hypothetical protein